MQTIMNIEIQKKNLRKLCFKKRDDLKKNDINSSLHLKKNILKIKEFNEARVIASFISIKTEISTKPLNDFIHSLGKKICLPVILNNNNSLLFRLYNKYDNLKIGKFNIPEPEDKKEEILPDIILTPCLAFDQYGYRLGYGGGYYDRTFFKLRKVAHPFVSVAVAYDDQKINKVTRTTYDERIHYILTEKEIYKVK